MNNPLRLSAAVLVTAALALGAAACGTSSPASPGSGGSAGSAGSTGSATPKADPSGSGKLLLRVRDGGGFVPVPPAANFPRVSLYEDGTLVTAAAPKRYGLPAPRVAHLSDAEVRAVVGAAKDAGLPHSGTLGPTPPADGPTRSYVLDGKLTITVAPSLRDCAEQKALCVLDKKLDALAEPSEAYPYATLAAVFHETAKGRSSGAVAWPLGKLANAGEPALAGRCVLLKGKDLTEVQRVARTAKTAAWSDGAATYQMALRPLLPGESSCADAIATG